MYFGTKSQFIEKYVSKYVKNYLIGSNKINNLSNYYNIIENNSKKFNLLIIILAISTWTYAQIVLM